MTKRRAARRNALTVLGAMASVFAGCGGGGSAGAGGKGPSGHVILIDIDDHGLAGLWAANAPNLKSLIAHGTLAFSRVVVPTHSNQNNIALLTGQYPDGNDAPANDWLSRANGFQSPVSVGGALTIGDYALYAKNPLLTRGDSVYRATHRAGGRTAYVGELPPFEAGAEEAHLTIVGTEFATPLGLLTVDKPTAENILTGTLGYPQKVADSYVYDGPPASGETQTQFTLRAAADFVRATSPAHPMPAFMFLWDFLALDDDPTTTYGADGPQLARIIEDYDAGLGQLLTALDEKGLTATTNILFTLDHGKVDTHKQVVLGTHGGADADGQLGALVAAQGAAMGIDGTSYALLNEDGDAHVYANVPGAGTPAGAAAQAEVTHKLLSLIQSGAIAGLDTTRTMTADGAMGTRTFKDFRATSPNQPDILVFPQDDWTLNQVDATNSAPGPFQQHVQYPYGRHGGFSADELYVPVIMAGPAFKSGVLLPHPVLHPDIAATALAALGPGVALQTAARGPIHAALAGDPGETVPLPDPPDGARDLVLNGSGFGAPPPGIPGPAPTATAVLIDVAGLYEDELFNDPATADAAAPFRALAAAGTRFEDCWTESRDWAVTELQMLAGGTPVAPFVPFPEADPTVTVAPGAGLLAMPPPANFVASPDALAAWHSTALYAADSLFQAAHRLSLATALVGTPDFHLLHVDPAGVDMTTPVPDPAAAAAAVSAAAGQPAFVVVAMGDVRAGDRHGAQAAAELRKLGAAVTNLAAAVPGALIAVTSRGATPIDGPAADFYGPGSSRHVPLILVGPGVRAGVVTGEPATPADIPATLLYGLGAPSRPDVAQGTWAIGADVGGIPQPSPAAATQGHALLRAFAP
ncbi:MAG TPA: alkaline phosphatase family protein [Polyangia bacterium]|nr:alkaline phosphatase family protein [Polyangia bacterium]